jgi:hypothetical protein
MCVPVHMCHVPYCTERAFSVQELEVSEGLAFSESLKNDLEKTEGQVTTLTAQLEAARSDLAAELERAQTALAASNANEK